jgi:DNA polymerase III gamma/tau subunit
MRDAQSLLEQVLASVTPGEAQSSEASVDGPLLEEILGLAERKILYELSNAVIQGDAKRCLDLVADVVAHGCDLCRLSRDLVEHFRDLMVARLTGGKTGETGQLLDIPDQEIADLNAQVQSLSVETLLDYFDFMAAGDEEVARSANPRFALEALLVKLAILPKMLPVAQLLERLEKLEQKVKADAKPYSLPVNETRTPVQIPQGAETAALQAGPSPAKVDANLSADKDKVWQSFISFVGKEKKFLASHLESCVALELPPGQLKIAVVDRHHLNYLQDADNLSAFRSLAQRFFAEDVSINVTAGAAEGPAKLANTEQRSEIVPATESSETVKDALRIFGGSIRSVRREDA